MATSNPSPMVGVTGTDTQAQTLALLEPVRLLEESHLLVCEGLNQMTLKPFQVLAILGCRN